MLIKQEATTHRDLRLTESDADLVVVGGGLAGTCCAITAARAGLRTVLVQDRPVLGGNASSEVRLWILGATAHMGNNCRWARESGVVGEIMIENMHRNPEGNALLVDAVMLDKARAEPNLTLLLNTAALDCAKATDDPDRIASVRALCSQNATEYNLRAPLFCDASGDGILGFRAGAAFRMGAEARAEFDEKFAPDESYGSLLGHSIYFYAKDAGRPVEFVPPSFALSPDEVVERIPRHGGFKVGEDGCRLWWIEFGGRLDTIHDTEAIKWKLWKVAYGVWNYFKNSGRFPEARHLTLEWIGHVPGKRESRRFEGDYMLTQHDVVEQRRHADDVAYGGWAIDLHPADGVYSPLRGCTQWHMRGIYPIPYRCLYSRNVRNLFMAGRLISVSHVAFGSTRVMATGALAGQAVAIAAALCKAHGVLPRELGQLQIHPLQQALLRTGQHIPGVRLDDADDLFRQATIGVSSQRNLAGLPPSGRKRRLSRSLAQMLPVSAGPMPRVTVRLDADVTTTQRFELRSCRLADHHTPEVVLAVREVSLSAGTDQPVELDFDVSIDEPRYVFVCAIMNPLVSVHMSAALVTGVVAVTHHRDQRPETDIGIEPLELWSPLRRPADQNMAVSIDPPLSAFGPANLSNGLQRPTCGANAWIAAFDDAKPTVTLQWPQPVDIGRVVIGFDADYDHPMESVLMGHPERHMPYCVRHFRLLGDGGTLLFEDDGNYRDRREITFDPAVRTARLEVECLSTWGSCSPAIFEIRVLPPGRGWP